MVFYVEGLGHNLFSVGQLRDSDLEVAFRKHICFVRNLEGVDLLTGSRGTNLYTFSIGDMMKSFPICLLSKASKTKSWLWHRRLSHLNFGTINQLAKKGLFRGLPKLKFEKDHLCSGCSLGKRKKQSHIPKSKDTNQEKLYLLHMDLCGLMRVESINEKKYILVIVDDYSRFTWVKFLRSKDEAPEFIINYYEDVGISHETSVARTPQHNDVVDRRNHTLVEAARTMLIYAKAPLFLWAKAVATACYTQNRSLIRLRHGKTPYELLHDRKPDLCYLYVFGALCYLTNDSEDLGKLKSKVNVAMASEQSSSGPTLHEMTPETLSSGLVPQPPSLTPFIPPTRDNWDTLLQPLFDEYFRPPPCVDHLVPEVAAPVPAISTGSPSSTLVDQGAPSPSTSQTSQAFPSYVIAPGAEEADHDIEKARQLELNLYDGNFIKSTSAIVILDSEETIMLAEESRSRMLLKQQDLMVLETKVNTTPVDYAILNQLSQDFKKRFVPQPKLFIEQGFWSQNSINSSYLIPSCRPTKVKILKELPKVILAVEQHRLESTTFELKMNQVLNENKRLLEQVINKDIVNIVVNSFVDNASVNMQVKPSTSASRSQPSDKTKKDKIQRPPRTAIVQHSKRNTNSKLICVKCNGCMLSDNHDLCVLNVINDVNAHPKSKSIKKTSNRKVWNQLVRITTTTEVPPRKLIALETDTSKPVVTLVYSRKPRKSKTNILVSKPKIIKSISANNKKPSKSWGFIVSDVPSSSLDECIVDPPAPEVIAPIAEVVAPEPATSTGSHSSTTVDQDAPSPSNSRTSPETQSTVIFNDVEEENHDLDVAHMNNNPLFSILIPENISKAFFLRTLFPLLCTLLLLTQNMLINGLRIIL
nr:retrovirus-related Pol polyprotein from transposon TNT 1-94 [Tanacetum cinerariifolium]